MCGIVGYIGEKFVDSVLLVGLERLEYRGYDSAGIATLDNGELAVRKRVGKLKVLDASLKQEPLGGHVGIGHTRWATHGEPTEINAHPHLDCTKTLAVVHNGIIENYVLLKEKLIKEGHVFTSETDSEVIPHLIEKYFEGDLFSAVQKAVSELTGAYAIAVISEREPGTLVAARHGSPLILGAGTGENFIASDISAVVHHTHKVVYLKDGEVAALDTKGIRIKNVLGNNIAPDVIDVDGTVSQFDKCGYEHFMLKEIHEQPGITSDVLTRRINEQNRLSLDEMKLSKEYLAKVGRIVIQACGTSWHAGLTGKSLLERFARIHTEVDTSSEFRYRNPVLEGDTLVMAISQSGETADTLAGIREAKSKFLKVLSLCNVSTSTIARESDGVINISAGPEIGVASTKAYTAELLALYLFTFYLARLKWILSDEQLNPLLSELKKIPEKMRFLLSNRDVIMECAERYHKANHFIFLGRGYNYPNALEGALKLKEISYIHATGYPAGEIKHGPIAMIDSSVPVVCIAPQGELYSKMVNNIQEVRARKGLIIAIASEADREIKNLAQHVITIPECSELFSPLLIAIPLQLLAYHIAIKRGCDVDKPRNLAKSVTVE